MTFRCSSTGCGRSTCCAPSTDPREPEQVRTHAEAAIALAKEHGFELFAAMGAIFRGWARSMLGEGAAGAAEVRRGYEDYRRTGAESSRAHWCALLAQAHRAAGE